MIEFVVSAGRRADERRDVYGARRPQSREARLQRRRRLAGGDGTAAAGGGGGAGDGRAAAHAGRRRAGARRRASRARRARVSRRSRSSTSSTATRLRDVRAADAESREAADREPDGRRQRRHRALSRRARVSIASPRREVARTLGADPRAGAQISAIELPAAPDSGALNAFLGAAQGRRSGYVSGLVDHDHQAARIGRVRRRSAGRGAARPFRSRGPRLCALDGAEPAVPGSRHAAARESGARGPPVAVLDRASSKRSPCSARARRTTRTRSSARSASRPRRWSSSRASASRFDAIVTGASNKGTWVRVSKPPIEGMLVRGAARPRRRRSPPRRACRRRRRARIYRLRPNVNRETEETGSPQSNRATEIEREKSVRRASRSDAAGERIGS